MSDWHLELTFGITSLALIFGVVILTRPSVIFALVIVAGGYLAGRADGMRWMRKHCDKEVPE